MDGAYSAITERQFSQQVVALARRLGWRVYRTWLSVRSPLTVVESSRDAWGITGVVRNDGRTTAGCIGRRF